MIAGILAGIPGDAVDELMDALTQLGGVQDGDEGWDERSGEFATFRIASLAMVADVTVVKVADNSLA